MPCPNAVSSVEQRIEVVLSECAPGLYFHLFPKDQSGFLPQPAGYFSFDPIPLPSDHALPLSDAEPTVLTENHSREEFSTYQSTLGGVSAQLR